MNLPTIILLCSSAFHLISCGGFANGEKVAFIFRNKCTFPVWPAAAPSAGHPVIANGGFFLASGLTKIVEVPPTWIGRFWGRTGCKFNSNSTEGPGPACETGDCEGGLACDGTIGLPPFTLVEVSLHNKEPNHYDVSLVDGFNIPISVSSRPDNANCSIAGCSKNINSVCPKDLKVLDRSNKTIACKSACLAFDEDSFCCRKEHGTPETCKTNSYTKTFKEACPNYFSHPFDTPSPLKRCSSDEYVITFCPSKLITNSSPESKPVWSY